MLLKECYDKIGGDYESVFKRIPKDSIIEKFLIKFLSEPSYNNLCDFFDKEDYEEAFRAAHSLKGVCINLGFNKLAESASDITEFLRDSSQKTIDKSEGKRLLQLVTDDYNFIIAQLQAYVDTLS